MILAVDVGNTNVVLGLTEGGRILRAERLATERGATDFEYALRVGDALALAGVDPREIAGAIVSSVVPPVTAAIRGAVELLTGTAPLVAGPGMKTGMRVLTDNPAAVGTDRIVDAAAARARYPLPLIVLDMGTANTFSVLNAQGDFMGGVILPGLRLGMDALARSTSLLPQVSLERPRSVIGRNTVDSIRSGLLYGCAAALDGVIGRIKGELGCDCPVIVTGGLAPLVIPLCRQSLTHDPDLLLKGLVLLYQMNQE